MFDSVPDVEKAVQEDFLRILESMVHDTKPLSPISGAIIAGVKDFVHFNGKYNDLSDIDTFQIAIDNGEYPSRWCDTTSGIPCNIHLPERSRLSLVHAGRIGEVIPKQPNLVWNGNPAWKRPDFEFREIWWAYGGPAETAG